MSEKKEWAQWYASVGWRVFPCHWIHYGHCSCGQSGCSSAGKHPFGKLVSRGCQDASCDPDVVAEWWEEYPDSNIGLSTDNLFVVDLDVKDNGVKNFARLVQRNGGISPTVSARSGSGGVHLLFKHPGFEQRNRAAVIPGVDIRAHHGYIIAPPSTNLMGPYVWREGKGPSEIPLADADQWLKEMVEEKKIKFVADPKHPKVVLDLNDMADIQSGSRHAQLLSIVGTLTNQETGDYSAPPESVAEMVLAKLRVVNEFKCKPPIEEEEELKRRKRN